MLADRVISCAQSLECHRAWHHGAYLAIIKAGLPRATRCSIERVEVETKNTRNEITTSVRWKTLLCMPAGMPRSTGVICATRGQTYTQNTDFTSPPFILTSGSHFRNDAIRKCLTQGQGCNTSIIPKSKIGAKSKIQNAKSSHVTTL